MPRLFSEHGSKEAAFWQALTDDMDDAALRLIFDDWRQEQGMSSSADLFRSVEVIRQRCQGRLRLGPLEHLARLRARELTEEECGQIVGALRTLLAADPVTLIQPMLTKIESQFSALLGAPDPCKALDPRDPEHLRTQYDLQRSLLASMDVLEHDGNFQGITGINGKFYPLPTFEDIGNCFKNPAVRHKVGQGFNQLLLVPFALPLSCHLDAWRRNLLRNEHLLPQPTAPRLYWEWRPVEPCIHWEPSVLRCGYYYNSPDGRGPDEDGRLVYAPRCFENDHGGRTKEQLLACAPSRGWHVLLIEGDRSELPREGEGQEIGGRAQIEAGSPFQHYLQSLPRGEVGWTPETYMWAFMTHLERTGQLLDTTAWTYLIGSYFPGLFFSFSIARWSGWHRQARLSEYVDVGDQQGGARTAVEIA